MASDCPPQHAENKTQQTNVTATQFAIITPQLTPVHFTPTIKASHLWNSKCSSHNTRISDTARERKAWACQNASIQSTALWKFLVTNKLKAMAKRFHMDHSPINCMSLLPRQTFVIYISPRYTTKSQSLFHQAPVSNHHMSASSKQAIKRCSQACQHGHLVAQHSSSTSVEL